MPSSYSARLRLELQATGENRSTWGTKANNDFSLIEDAIAGAATVNILNTDTTLTTSNGSADQARCAFLVFTGTLTADRTVTIPAVSKQYICYNTTTGGFAVKIKTSAIGATTVSVPNGKIKSIWTLGGASTYSTDQKGTMSDQDANAVAITGGTITGITDLAIADGGTGASTAADARTNLDVYSKGEIDVISVPTGGVLYFAKNTPPSGFLKANGAAISRTTYANLFAVIGTTFGAGNGTTTFNVPDLRGVFPRGWDDGRGMDTGRTFGSYQADAYASHNHGVTDPGHTHTATASTAGNHSHAIPATTADTGDIGSNFLTNAAEVYGTQNSNAAGAHTHTITVASRTTGITTTMVGGTETRPVNVALLAVIKY